MKEMQSNTERTNAYRYIITGTAAHERIKALLPKHWIDCTGSCYKDNNYTNIDFIWENAPRHETKYLRDSARVYSHLPNGISILDDKCVLSRLFQNFAHTHTHCNTTELNRSFSETTAKVNSVNYPHDVLSDTHKPIIENNHYAHELYFAPLESYCFRGITGLELFANRVGLIHHSNNHTLCICSHTKDQPNTLFTPHDSTTTTTTTFCTPKFIDLFQCMTCIDSNNTIFNTSSPTINSSTYKSPFLPYNLWVLKDASSNGVGGIWFLDSSTIHTFLSDSKVINPSPTITTQPHTPLLREEHRYVAQRYAWPPILYKGRKFHVRVYGLITSDGRCFLHKRAFLHVANLPFHYHDEIYNIHNDDTNTPTVLTTDMNSIGQKFDPAVHITNCCANSHDKKLFAGEICADLDVSLEEYNRNKHNVMNSTKNNELDDILANDKVIIPLGDFFPSMKASLATLLQESYPFIQGGEANNGFEYLGLDFILSYKLQTNQSQETTIPIAYLLEVNSPPSQDTATGLPHAENLHNEVLRDLMNFWVIPRVISSSTHRSTTDKSHFENTFGWKFVHQVKQQTSSNDSLIVPSKATILNKMRWALHEKKLQNIENSRCCTNANVGEKASTTLSGEVDGSSLVQKVDTSSKASTVNHANDFSNYARENMSYILQNENEIHFGNDSDTSKSTKIFLENAGGSQVPIDVIQSMVHSLSYRHRSSIGSQLKSDARKIMLLLLGGSQSMHNAFFGQNATTLLHILSMRYLCSKFLKENDEIIIASENHLANITPWINLSNHVGATIKWLTCFNQSITEANSLSSSSITDLLSTRTRLVCISHSSNIYGIKRDVKELCLEVRQKCPSAHIIVDGVALVPHQFADIKNLGIDWYVVSCHKFFGPHIGVLCGLKSAANMLNQSSSTKGVLQRCVNHDDPEEVYRFIELGTQNYEGCAGIIGLGSYFMKLASYQSSSNISTYDKYYKTTTAGERTNQNSQIGDALSNFLSTEHVRTAYDKIRKSEQICLDFVLSRLSANINVHIFKGDISHNHEASIPIISFIHEKIQSKEIVNRCFQDNIVIRNGTFLCADVFLKELGIMNEDGERKDDIVRISFCHYNTLTEAQILMNVLESIENWW